MFVFGNLPDPRRLRCARTLRYAWLYPRQSQASLGGYYGGTPECPQKSPTFFRKTSVSPLSFSYTWKKRTRGVSNYGTGPAESWGRLRLRDTAPPSPPHAYVAYECEIPRRSLSKSHTRTRKWSKENAGSNAQGLDGPHSRFNENEFLIFIDTITKCDYNKH